MLESKIQAKIIKYLKKETYCIKTISTNKSGVPDLICCYKGIFIAFEVKASGKEKTVSELQQHHIQEIIKNGGLAFIVSSLEEVENIIRRIK